MTSIRTITCTKVITRATKILEVIRRIWVLKVPLVDNLFCNHIMSDLCQIVVVPGFEPGLRQSKCRVLANYTTPQYTPFVRLAVVSGGVYLVDPFALFCPDAMREE